MSSNSDSVNDLQVQINKLQQEVAALEQQIQQFSLQVMDKKDELQQLTNSPSAGERIKSFKMR